MSNSIIILPYNGTTSGQLMDSEQVSVAGNTVERERVQISGAAAAAIAPVTTSYGLLVGVSTATPIVLTSGTVTLSSNPTIISASSGAVQVYQSTSPWAVSLSSGTVTLSSDPTVVSASSGLIQSYQAGTWTVALSSNPVASQTVSLSSGTVTLSSNPTVISASSGLVQISGTPFVNLVGTSSGVAPVTTSGGLLVTVVGGGSGSTVVSLSSNITVISASSGLVQISGTPTILSASSGFVQTYLTGTSGGTAPVTTSGGVGVTILGGAASGSTAVNIIGTSGGIAPVTTSGGMGVTILGGAAGGSTDVSIVGSTGTQWQITSAGTASVVIESSGGIIAPVTSSWGLLVTQPTHRLDTTRNAIAAPVTETLTTSPCTLHSINVSSTAATSHCVKYFTATTLTSNASTFFSVTVPAAAGVWNFPFSAGGVACTGGLYFTVTLNATSTNNCTIILGVTTEYTV